MLEDIKRIKPQNIKQDDKYSKNLYNYLKLNGYKDFPSSVHVYFNKNQGSFEEPKFTEIDWENLKTGDIYIGSNVMKDVWGEEKKIDFGQVICKNLGSILRGNKLKEQGVYCAFGHSYINRDWIEITDEFWEKYIEYGLCLFDSHTFKEINDKTRRCKYCGLEQHKIIKTYSYEEWSDK